MTLEAIKDAFQHLSESDREAFATWVLEHQNQAWDEQFEKDFAPGGRAEALIQEVERQIEAGLARPIEERCAKRRPRRKLA